MGKFVTEWNAATDASKTKLQEVDVAAGVATLLAVKDEQEIVRPYPIRSTKKEMKLTTRRPI